jgi:DNA-binding MarR family transcriptional regulator
MALALRSDIDTIEPLTGWMDSLIRFVQSDRPDLTNRQMGLLLVVYLTEGPHTVRGLAAKLHVSKPVVTRALNTLGALSYVRRQRDETDLRNVFVERTQVGRAFLEEFSRIVAASRAESTSRADERLRASH